MKIHALILPLLLLTLLPLAASAQQLPEWQQIEAFRKGQLDPHVCVVPYASGPGARTAIADQLFAQSPWYMSLNGEWDFKWSASPADRPADFYRPEASTEAWDKIKVPGNWQAQGFGTKVYVNERYEFGQKYYNFEKNPPFVPADSNEVGSYRKLFRIPADWAGRRTVLCIEGAASFYYIWLNGELLGYNQDSKTAAEWDITDKLVQGDNTLAIEMYRWSAGSYLECQDMWRLSGIERDVYLYSTPLTYVADYTVTSPLDAAYRDGLFGLDTRIAGADIKGSLAYTLYSPKGAVVAKGEKALAEEMLMEATVKDVEAWSAETPALYTLVMQLKDADGRTTETLGCNVGFRTSEIKNGQFCLNGKPVLIKGVNRHAFTQLGHYVDEATMLRDIELMKRSNINTVRNSHYPMERRWYHLADKHGLYIIDEANVESHGMGYGERSLATKIEWLPAIMDRTQRMYAKSKNNPSVTFYSLGNESGNGINFEETYKWMKAVEKNRPIQHERAFEAYNTDVYAYMYRPIDVIEAYCHKDGIYRPYIVCEYAHAMGNSVGGLRDYWEMFEREPVAQGGCIWDWVDQSFIEHTPEGTLWYAYGGDYGPKGIPSDGSFCCNGLVNSDRTPHPHLAEVKAVYRNIKSELVSADPLVVKVRNWYFFTNLVDFDMNWSLVDADGNVLAKGVRKVACAPQKSAELAFGNLSVPDDGREIYLNIDWTPRKSTAMVPAGYPLAQEQLVLRTADMARTDKALPLKGRNGVYSAAGLNFAVDPASGALTSLTSGGVELLAEPVELSLFRPLTENDAHRNGSGRKWFAEGLDSISTDVRSIKLKNNVLTVDSRVIGRTGAVLGTASMRYSVLPGQVLAVGCTFVPDTAAVHSLPRVGLTYRTPAELARSVAFLGREGETYVDRNTAGRIGRHTITPESDFHRYIVPQSSGNHTDVRSVDFNDGLLAVSAAAPFQFSAVPYSDANIQAAKHLCDLTDDGLVTVHLDAEQTGVGTATCGPDVLPKYRIAIRPIDFTFYFKVKK
ncbi:MAG: DUF4981 domain-containing protein [Muribaculaceae bacterium]|nr:DUF4981 domain-containing protein [Muribaculaceae bacterium]